MIRLTYFNLLNFLKLYVFAYFSLNKVFINYKNIHKDETVFIIGNGPSLNETNLDFIGDSCSIALNRIDLIYKKYSKWKPTYYIYGSNNVEKSQISSDWINSINNVSYFKKTTCFIHKRYKNKIISNRENIKFFNLVTENKASKSGKINKNIFSTNIVRRIDKSITSINMALQLAVHMGFKRIILLGVDLNFKNLNNSSKDHFDHSYRHGDPDKDMNKANVQVRNLYSLIKHYCLENYPNIQIYNASPKSVLDIFKFISFDKLLKENRIVTYDDKLNNAKNFWEQPAQKFK